MLTYVPFSAIVKFFSHTLYVVVGPGWESLAYILTLGMGILMFKVIYTSLYSAE